MSGADTTFARKLPAWLLIAGILVLAFSLGADSRIAERTAAGTKPTAAPAASAAGPFRFSGPTQCLKEMFSRFDTDGDGWLSRKELRRFNWSRSKEPRDLDGDGTVSEAEFERFFRGVYEWRPIDRFVLIAGQLSAECRLLEAGFIDKALSRARSAVVSFPEWSEAWSLLSEVLAQSELFEQAAQAARQAVAIAPNNDRACIAMAFSLAAAGATTESARALERGLQLMKIRYEMFDRDLAASSDRDYDLELCSMMGRFMYGFRSPGQAVRIGDWARQHWSLRPMVEAQRLVALSMLGLGDQALSEAAAAESTGSEGRYYFLVAQGRILLQMGRAPEAIALFKAALAVPGDWPDRQMISLDLGSSLMRSGRTTEAALMLEQARAGAAMPAAKLRVAGALIEAGSPAKAAELLEDVVAAAQGVPGFWLQLAEARAATGDRSAYIATLERGLACCRAPGFREQAAMMLESARTGDPFPTLPHGAGPPPGSALPLGR